MAAVVPPRPRRSTAGQAAIEYVAAIALVAAVLTAGTAVAAPGIPARVVHTVRLGMCIVAGDVCTPPQARAEGLAPCTVSGWTRGGEGQIEIVNFVGAKGSAYTWAQDSEGRVTIVRSDAGRLGLQTGVELGFGALAVGADAGVDLRMLRATAWEFPDAAHAHQFVDGLPQSAEPPSPYLSWRSFDSGPEGYAEAGVAALGHTLAGIEAAADGALGLRAGHGVVTVYFRAQLQRPGPAGDLDWGPGGNAGNRLGELELVHGRPRELALRSVESSRGGSTLVETVERLDLRDPANLAAVEHALGRRPWSPAALPALLGRIAQAGTVERSTYSVADRSKTFDLAVKLGEELGLEVTITHSDKRLVGASAWTRGSAERERFDCTPRPSQ
jgi:hypothetical protein